jgi:hypothetical protein
MGYQLYALLYFLTAGGAFMFGSAEVGWAALIVGNIWSAAGYMINSIASKNRGKDND